MKKLIASILAGLAIVSVAYAATYTSTNIKDWSATTPAGTDAPSELDDSIREIKACINNSVPFAYNAVTAATTVGPTSFAFGVSTSTEAVTLTLPTNAVQGKMYFIYKADNSANALTIDPQTATIDGVTTDLSLTALNAYVLLVVDSSSNYHVVSESGVTSGTSTLSSSYITTTSYASTGLTVTLPRAGRYLLTANVLGLTTGVADLEIIAQLSDGSAIANTETLVAYSASATGSYYGNGVISMVYTATGATTITLQAKKSGTGTATVVTGTTGRTRLTWQRIN